MFNMDYISRTLFSNYIKYEKMNELTLKAFANTQSANATSINVFIDTYSIIKSYYSDYATKDYSKIKTSIDMDDYTYLTSIIINLCAHIRNYYRTRHGVETNIFIIHSDNIPSISCKILPNYNVKHALNKTNKPEISNMVDKNIELLETLVPLLPNVYLLKGNIESMVMISDVIQHIRANMIKDIDPNTPNIIYSKDILMYQLLPLYNETVIFRPYKHNGVDDSILITNDTLYQSYRKALGAVSADRGMLNTSLFSLLISLAGLKERSIKSLFNINKSNAILEEAVSNMRIPNDYSHDIQYTVDQLIFNKDVSRYEIVCRFRCLDLQYQELIYKNDPNRIINISNIRNEYDTGRIQYINNNHFTKYPLDLNNL